jgi:hypothetical protein
MCMSMPLGCPSLEVMSTEAVSTPTSGDSTYSEIMGVGK